MLLAGEDPNEYRLLLDGLSADLNPQGALESELIERVASVLWRLRRVAQALGATALYIYGSRARGDERPDGDLDVFVDFDPEIFGLVELVELRDMRARELGVTCSSARMTRFIL